MQVRRHRSPARFQKRARAFLLEAEAENGLFLAIGRRGGSLQRDGYLATVESGDEVLACAVRTPPYGLNLTRATSPAVDVLVEDVARKYGDLSSVRGPEPAVTHFAARWSARTGRQARLIMRVRLFEARCVEPLPSVVPGSLRAATDADLESVEPRAIAFHREAGTRIPVDPAATTRLQLAAGQLFVWDREGPVSMAATGHRSDRSVPIDLVYTPPEHRRRGYASACVAALTRQLLSGGAAFCCISADVSNETTNRIYPAIGYRPVCELSHIDLDPD